MKKNVFLNEIASPENYCTLKVDYVVFLCSVKDDGTSSANIAIEFSANSRVTFVFTVCKKFKCGNKPLLFFFSLGLESTNHATNAEYIISYCISLESLLQVTMIGILASTDSKH